MGKMVSMEEEHEGEMIVGPGGEMLRPPSKDTLHIQTNSFSKSAYYSSDSLCGPYYYFLIGEALEEGDDKTEEPESPLRSWPYLIEQGP